MLASSNWPAPRSLIVLSAGEQADSRNAIALPTTSTLRVSKRVRFMEVSDRDFDDNDSTDAAYRYESRLKGRTGLSLHPLHDVVGDRHELAPLVHRLDRRD